MVPEERRTIVLEGLRNRQKEGRCTPKVEAPRLWEEELEIPSEALHTPLD